jgi:hypothetical protein
MGSCDRSCLKEMRCRGRSLPATAFRLHQCFTVIRKNSFSPTALLACYYWIRSAPMAVVSGRLPVFQKQTFSQHAEVAGQIFACGSAPDDVLLSSI